MKKSRVHALFHNSGAGLFFVRLPFRVLKVVLDKINTIFYSFFLGEIGRNVVIEFGVRIESPRGVKVGDGVFIGKGSRVVTEVPGSLLIIESGVEIGRNCHIDHTGDVIIGETTLLSEGVAIYSHSHGLNPRSLPIGMRKEIGNGCWLGARSIILENAKKIHDGTVVAAASVVSKSTEQQRLVVAGVPAKVINRNVN